MSFDVIEKKSVAMFTHRNEHVGYNIAKETERTTFQRMWKVEDFIFGKIGQSVSIDEYFTRIHETVSIKGSYFQCKRIFE